MKPVALLLMALLLASQGAQAFQNYKAIAITFALKSSAQVFEVYRPYLSQIALWASEPDQWGDCWNHVYYEDGSGHLPEVVEYYFYKACEHLRMNELEDSAKYLAYALSYLLDACNPFNTCSEADGSLARAYRRFLNDNIEGILSRVDSSSLRVVVRAPREIVEDLARLSRRLYPRLENAFRKGDYKEVYEVALELIRAGLEGCLSLLSQLPLSAFERVLNTPVLKEIFYASLVVTAISAAYLARQRALREEEVEVSPEEAPVPPPEQ